MFGRLPLSFTPYQSMGYQDGKEPEDVPRRTRISIIEQLWIWDQKEENAESYPDNGSSWRRGLQIVSCILG